jgi:hypothetical protein
MFTTRWDVITGTGNHSQSKSKIKYYKIRDQSVHDQLLIIANSPNRKEAKLNNAQKIKLIKKRIGPLASNKNLAKLTGETEGTISHICTGRNCSVKDSFVSKLAELNKPRIIDFWYGRVREPFQSSSAIDRARLILCRL